MTIEELVLELSKISNLNSEVLVNHHINTDNGHGYHNQTSKVTKLTFQHGSIILDSEFIEINADIKDDFFKK